MIAPNNEHTDPVARDISVAIIEVFEDKFGPVTGANCHRVLGILELVKLTCYEIATKDVNR